MRCWPLIGEAEQKPGSARPVCNLSHRTWEYQIGEHDDGEDVGGLQRFTAACTHTHTHKSVCIRYPMYNLSAAQTMNHFECVSVVCISEGKGVSVLQLSCKVWFLTFISAFSHFFWTVNLSCCLCSPCNYSQDFVYWLYINRQQEHSINT